MAEDRMFGVGDAAGGQIRAVVTDGHLADLEISPMVMRRGGMDSRMLAAEVARAVNAAIDDLVRQSTAGLGTGSVAAELAQVSVGFARAIDEVTAELERAERRIDTR
jgi:hypothetical protein